MALIEEIQAEAVDSNANLGAVLRKCKLLAARLGSQQFEDWLVWESNGYPDDAEVPGYRKWPLEVKGHFAGPFGSGIRNAPIPSICLPEKVREAYSNYECRQSISSIEKTLGSAEKTSTLHVPAGDLAVVLGHNVYQRQNCLDAWGEFALGNLLEVLNTVRNKILDFTIAIWKEDPTAGEVIGSKDENIEPSKVTQIFNTTVFGGAANLVGSSNNSIIDFNVVTNDVASLENALKQNNVSDSDIESLKNVLAEEQEAHKRFGPKVSSWIGKMVGKAADGSWNVSIGAASGILSQIISNFYGL